MVIAGGRKPLRRDGPGAFVTKDDKVIFHIKKAMNDNYCIICQGRGLDAHDHSCEHCGGTGIEPERAGDGADFDTRLVID